MKGSPVSIPTLGGWHIIMRRSDHTVFELPWGSYKNGFGDPSSSFWIGNDIIHELTKNTSRLRIIMKNTLGEYMQADYDSFYVADEMDRYRLSVSG